MLPVYQAHFGSLAVELSGLGLPEETIAKAEELSNDLREVVSGDGSDAVARFGGVDSQLYSLIQWAKKLRKSLDNGLQKTLSHVQRLRNDIKTLPVTGAPGQLRIAAEGPLQTISELLSRDSFFDEAGSIASNAAEIDTLIVSTIQEIQNQQSANREHASERVSALPDWQELSTDEREWTAEQWNSLDKTFEPTLEGLRNLLSHDYTINHKIREIESKVREKADVYRQSRQKSVPTTVVQERPLHLPAVISSEQELESLLKVLSEFMKEFRAGQRIRIRVELHGQDSANSPEAES